MALFAEYARFDACGLADLVRRGELRPRDVIDAAIARIERLNPRVNAVVHRMDTLARVAADGVLPDGPFRGVPLLLKDLLSFYAGQPLTSGSRFLQDFVPDHDSELVTRYRGAGFITLGKTNTPEFGLTPYTEPELFGPSRNPWDLSRTTGGSSGGSAAAVASGMVPVAGGGDGGGSIRIPASCCGVFGLKPTRGRVPTGPDFGELWSGAVVEHVLTRSVRDSAAVLDCTSGPDVGAPYYAPPPERPFLQEVTLPPGKLKVAWTTKPLLGGTVHPDCQQAVEETVRLLERLGHEVHQATPELDGPAFARAFLVMICAELAADIGIAERLLHRRATPGDFEVPTWALAVLGRAIPAAELSMALRFLEGQARRVARLFVDHDVLLTPTLARPPFPIGALQPQPGERRLLAGLGWLRAGALLNRIAMGELAQKVFEAVPYTPVFNVTGQPAMSVPLCWNRDGLPIGVHFVGRYADEATLFRLAGQLERERPWFDRVPPIAREI